VAAHDPDVELIEATNEPLAPSPAANRMRLHRQRRHMGLRCVVVELRETEIDDLTKKGFLKDDGRNDIRAVREALHRFFDNTLNPTP
jgi:predicted N-formylglutamate amidohydrolase